MNFGKPVTTALIISALLAALSGCQKKEDQAEITIHENQAELPHKGGSAEHAGQEIDEAAAKVGEKIEQTGENIRDSAKGEKD